jgi:hypothetical protein
VALRRTTEMHINACAGGGLYNNGGVVDIADSVFSQNDRNPCRGYDGALCNNRGTVTPTKTTLTNCVALARSGACHSDGCAASTPHSAGNWPCWRENGP